MYDTKTDSGVYFLFIDQGKAYDQIDQDFPWESMLNVAVPAPLCSASRNIYLHIKLGVMVHVFQVRNLR